MAKHERVSTLTLLARDRVGTTGARAFRREGRVPGVLFGHGRPAIAIAVESRALAEILAGGGGHRILDATLDGAHESVLLREVQRDPVTRRPITADFQRVSLTETITSEVRITTRGVARGVRDFEGVMDVVSHTLEIRGPAGSIPDELAVDVSELGIGDHITAGDVPLPGGFALVSPRDTIVISIGSSRAAVAEAEEAEAAPVAAAAEPAAAPTE